MTDRSPEIVTAADLTPVSPRPLPLSSPHIVPALQSQADIICGMSLNDEPANAMGSTSEAVEPEAVAQPETVQASSDQIPQHNSDVGGSSTEATGFEDASSDSVTTALNAGDAGDMGIISSADTADGPDDVVRGHESTHNSQVDSMTIQLPADASSHAPSTASVEAALPSSVVPIATAEAPSDALLSTSTGEADNAIQQPSQEPADQQNSNSTSSTPDAVDIQKLVDDITARASVNNTTQSTADNRPSTSASQGSTNLPQTTSSLPPKPPLPQKPAQPSIRYDDFARFPQGGLPSPATSMPPGFASTSEAPNPSAGAPGTVGDTHGNSIPHQYSLNDQGNNATPSFYYDTVSSQAPGNGHAFAGQTYEQFLQDEKKYVSEAKWDKFPQDSRLFIGNLSSERASKREVFEIFGKYGRLAQISLKQAYGFVQYHLLEEGQAAMKDLQGIDIKGRKIHLEYSRPQKKDGDDSRRRDTKSRGSNDRRDQDRYDGRSKRDDYGRPSSPRRGDHRRTDSHARDRGYGQNYDGYRGRSRSPPPYDRRGSDRRRSPSPYRRQHSELNLPRRYGNDIPDVQILLLQEVDRNFVTWVQRSLQDRALKVDVMFLDPRFPRNEVIQRQVVEGVHAVSEIDFRAQSLGKISLQVFDRSAGANNVRFDQYQDLDPHIAAELVLRAKSQVAPQQPAYGGHYAPPQSGYPYGAPQAAPNPPQAAGPFVGAIPTTAAGLANLDNATLQKLLASIQTQGGAVPAAPAAGAVYGQPGGYNAPAAASTPGYPNYGQPAAPSQPPPGNADSNQLVQNIMAQLSHFRQ